MCRLFCSTALVYFFLLAEAQPKKGLVASYTFNKGNPVNEISGNKVKAVGATLVDDRFGNSRSAYFLQGNYNSYINLGESGVLKPRVGTISLWFNISSIQHNGTGVNIN